MTTRLLVLPLFVTWLMGCATTIPDSPQFSAQSPVFHRVSLVTDSEPPTIKSELPSIEDLYLGHTRGEGAVGGAVGGAAGGAAAGVEFMMDNLGSDPYAPVAALLLLPVFTVGGAVWGAATGVESGVSPEELAEAKAKTQAMLTEARANAQAVFDTGYLQTDLLKRVQDYALANVEFELIEIPSVKPDFSAKNQSYKGLSDQSIDAVLEIELLRVTFKETLEMEARSRLVSTRTGEVLSDGTYRFISEHHSQIEWIENNAAPLLDAVDLGLQTLATNIVDEKFLLYYPHRDTKSLSNNAVPYYVLSPIYPEPERCIFCRPVALGAYKFVEVDSAQPLLRWESFPRRQDTFETNGVVHQVTDVSYDLRVFEATRSSSGRTSEFVRVPGQLVYEARGISEPYHKIEKALDSCANHFWTVRARFKLDGRVRVTEWTGHFMWFFNAPWELRRGSYSKGHFALSPADGPEAFYFPFKTACAEGK